MERVAACALVRVEGQWNDTVGTAFVNQERQAWACNAQSKERRNRVGIGPLIFASTTFIIDRVELPFPQYPPERRDSICLGPKRASPVPFQPPHILPGSRAQPKRCLVVSAGSVSGVVLIDKGEVQANLQHEKQSKARATHMTLFGWSPESLPSQPSKPFAMASACA